MATIPTFTPRSASRHRTTGETDVEVVLTLDGTGRSDCKTGIGFLDHMLALWARHGSFDLVVHCQGDRHVDEHHSVEDVAITLGQAFTEALGDKAYIARYGMAYVPMDEALARAVVDLSGRFYLVFDAQFARPTVGDLPTELVRHFWYSFAEHARCNLHISVLYGENTHHQVEAIFKAVARALREAVARDARYGPVLSTKGVL
ncbi:imidazoleglycerol-phosphate dehydratase HisB [Rhodothermus bifroesti]|uniref:Imidazoleglycerol-phosphate dehydratase n=1 Tax=Rhodothermus marinus TaxID=29549 RepID=A0A7V2F4Z9_RHOMR|nr:imidazoleglycerol-phosphate dehydratase HisB [Rhodothermus bifroesti]GBD02399.1 Histidine biosynthesis bifunctional protein HisB [bacterium HR18]